MCKDCQNSMVTSEVTEIKAENLKNGNFSDISTFLFKISPYGFNLATKKLYGMEVDDPTELNAFIKLVNENKIENFDPYEFFSEIKIFPKELTKAQGKIKIV